MTLSSTIRTRLIDVSLALGLTLALGLVYLVGLWSPVQEGGEADNLLSGSIYELRTDPKKAARILEFGGTAQTEAAVGASLAWMARHQAGDGSWSNACLGPKGSHPSSMCEEESACGLPGNNHITAQTGLALLALQAAGHYDFNDNTYSSNTRRGLEWLAQNQKPDGALVGAGSDTGGRGSYSRTFMYEHAIATFALAEACAIRKATRRKPVESLRDAAGRAVGFIETVQHDDGGWRYSMNTSEGSDTSVSGWAMLALKSAIEAGLPVDPSTVPRVRDFFAKCESADGRTGYTGPSNVNSNALTAVGMLVHLLLLKDHNAPLVIKAAPLLADQAAAYGRQIRNHRPEFYTLYNATLAMHQTGGENWDRWNAEIRDPVVAIQSRGPGCDRGSWDPASTHGGSDGGRIYSTALATLMLEVYYRYSRNAK